MTTIRATVADGRLEMNVPADWTDGTEVEIHPVAKDSEDDLMSSEEIARLLALMDQMEPLELTDAELADWEARKLARKEWEKAHFAEHAAKLLGMWQ